MKTLLPVQEKVLIIESLIDAVSETSTSNTYLGIGHVPQWSNGDIVIETPNESTDYINSVFRNLVALKRITASNISAVIRRKDWVANVVYDAYDNTVDMFSTIKTANANGTVSVSNSTVVVGTNTTFSTDFTTGSFIRLPGDGAMIGPTTKEVISVSNDTILTVNTAFSGAYTNNLAFNDTSTYPSFALNFYVRNTQDQVFKCLFNNHGALSTAMPMISIGGNLPESTYIVTADGYFWKYMYSIPSSTKQRFLTADWMPVAPDATVVAAADNGSIDVIKINAAGTGYNGNVASNTAPIITVVGDGTGANVSAMTSNTGAIIGYTILDGGLGYTRANVVVASGVSGNGANLTAVIGPYGGHGSDPVSELGASQFMVAVDLSGSENNTIPTVATQGTDVFDYHQIVMLKDPMLVSGSVANGTNYNTSTSITTQSLPAGLYFHLDETVFQGPSLDNATFAGTVVFWDGVTNTIYVNNTVGTFVPFTPIRGTQMSSPVTAFLSTAPTIKPFTGSIFYINNTSGIVRSSDQTEQIKLVLAFK